MNGAVGLALLVQADSARELDELITSMPVWPRMETEVTPLTTFGERAQTVRSKLEQLKAQTKKAAELYIRGAFRTQRDGCQESDVPLLRLC